MNSGLLHCRLVPQWWAILAWCHKNLGFLLLWGNSNIQSLKSRHKIKWLFGALDSDGKWRWGFQSQLLHASPHCSIWVSCTSQWTGYIAACFTNGNVKARKCVAELGVGSFSCRYLTQCSAPRISLLTATNFLHTAKRVTDSSSIVIRLSLSLGCHFVPACFMCPIFPLIWIRINKKPQFL